MSKIVRNMSNFLILPILIYGLYIIMHGHSTPGGGFQGGAVVASGVALLIVAFGSANIHQSLKVSHLSAQLARSPHEVLRDYYSLTAEERAALASSDIRKIEAWVGKLDKELAT